MTAIAQATRAAGGSDPGLHVPEPAGPATMGIRPVAGLAFHAVSGGQEGDARSWVLDASTSLATRTPVQRAVGGTTHSQRRECTR